MMKHDYAKNMKQFDFYVPIPEVGSVEKDSVRFLDALGVQWNSYLAWKRTLRQLSVFTFFTKIAKFVLVLRRSFLVFLH